MKPRFTNQGNRAMTVFEVVVVIVVLMVLAVVFLPVLEQRQTCQRINCVANLKQVNLALRIWEGDNNYEYPMGISVTNGGAMELIATGNVVGCFQVISNELSTTRILICPQDSEHAYATNFGNDFNNSHISYFINADVTNEDHPQMILDGDDNFQIGGGAVKSGLLAVSTNTPLAWDSSRHVYVTPRPNFWTRGTKKGYGNIGFADGSVQELTTLELQQALQQTGMATNHFAIP